MARGMCGVQGCERRHYAKGYCNPHYQRWTRYGNPQADKPIPPQKPLRPCTVEGCDNPVASAIHCAAHHQRLKRWGHVGAEYPLSRNFKLNGRKIGKTKAGGKSGYIRVWHPGHPTATTDGYCLEHRYVMSNHLDRPLHSEEHVHHKNGVRGDNRLENLQLVVRHKHHPGSKPEDLVEWANEILRRYGSNNTEPRLAQVKTYHVERWQAPIGLNK